MASTGEAFGLFWDSENGDRTYSASSFEYWLKKFFTSGVFNGDLQVKATSGMTLEVEAGYTNADGKVKFWNAPFNVTLDAANSTYPRIDTVVIRRDNVNRQITCEKVTGAYSGDTPQPTAPTRNSEIFELVIAQIYVGAGVTGITQSNITDTRPNNELCGYITGTVEELDFSAFTTQFEAYFAEFKRNQMADFQAWEVAQQAAYAAWFSLVQQQQIQDKADWDAWYAALQEELHELPEDTAEYLQIEIDEIRTSGTTGSILKITTTETSLEGKTVTVTNGIETRTATFDENLECLIAGYKGTGEVTISSSDGIQTASTVVTIPYFGNYTYNIAFWAATVNIQGDDNLKGATITVKDSDDLTVGTVVLNVITGRGVFTAQKADTYTFNFTYQGTDYSENLVVDEETTYSLELSAGFSWQTWVTDGGLDPTDYADLDEVLEDETALRRLFTVHASVDTLASIASASADVEKIINNDLCAKWINLRDYALDTLYANTIIKGYMDTADKYFYGEWALVGQVPTMTSNTAPYGTVSAKTQYSNDYAAWKAFDGSTAYAWNSAYNATSAAGEYIRFVFPTAVVINRLMENCSKTLSTSFISCLCYLEGSNTGNDGDWTKVGEFTPSDNSTHYYDFDNSTAYTYYQVRGIDKGNVFSQNSWSLSFTELQFYAYAPKGNVPIMTSNTAPYGTASATSEASGYQAYKIFDGNLSTGSSFSTSLASGYIQYKFANPINVKRIAWDDASSAGATTLQLSYSDDGSSFTNAGAPFTYTLAQKQTIVYFDVDDDYGYHLYWKVTRTLPTAGQSIGLMLQFYGRELSVSVPVMTSNTAPYGEAIYSSEHSTNGAWHAFDNDDTTLWGATLAATNNYVGYEFNNLTKLSMVDVLFRQGVSSSGYFVPERTFKVQGYTNDEWVDIGTITVPQSPTSTTTKRIILDTISDNACEKFRIFCADALSNSGANYTLTVCSLQFYGLDYSEKEFEAGATKKWLYDHGVELETFTYGGNSSYKVVAENDGEAIHLKTSGGAAGVYGAYAKVSNFDFEPYDLLRLKTGSTLSTTSSNNNGRCVQIAIFTVGTTTQIASLPIYRSNSLLPYNYSLDISSVDSSYDIQVFDANNAAAESTITELWLE